MNGKQFWELIFLSLKWKGYSFDSMPLPVPRILIFFVFQVVDIAKKYTGKSNETEAIQAFRDILNSSSMWHNNGSFPKNESDENAFKKCTSPETAAQFCPVRWKAVNKYEIWFVINYLGGIRASFDWVQNCFLFALLRALCDWSRKLAPLFQTIVIKTKIYSDWRGHLRFPALEADCLMLLWTLMGLLQYFLLIWLVVGFTLVLFSRHSVPLSKYNGITTYGGMP